MCPRSWVGRIHGGEGGEREYAGRQVFNRWLFVQLCTQKPRVAHKTIFTLKACRGTVGCRNQDPDVTRQ